MTLPSNIIFPLRKDLSDPKDIDRYLGDLTFQLQRMYEDLAQGVNGDIRGSAFKQREEWTPILNGTGVSGTFTYDHQIGWVLRKGLWTDVFGDISWSSAGLATGNLFVELPYKVALSDEKPFVGVVQSSVLAYTGGTGIVINSITNTFRGEFWNTGSGFTTANQSVVGTGGLCFHTRYLGIGNEA